MLFIIKSIIRWNKSITRRIKLFSLKLQYGKRFVAGKFNFRKDLRVVISRNGVLMIGNNVFLTTDVR